MSRMAAKRLPSGEPKSDDSRDDSQPKRLRTESSNENNSDNALLKRLWRTRRFSEGLVRLGSEPARCDLQLFPLVTHSLRVRRLVQLIGDEAGEGLALVIDLPDCPGDLDVFTTVGEFCLGLLDENDISISNVVQLIATSTFLEMENLTSRAFKFLEESAFKSWESCLGVLATFECSDLRDVGEGTLFHKCEKAFLHKIEVDLFPTRHDWGMCCSVQSLLHVAKLLPPNIAKHIFESCRTGKLGLFYDSTDSIYRYYNLIVTPSTEECTLKDGSIFYSILPKSKQYEWREWIQEQVQWIQELSYSLPDWSRRSTLLLHLAKSMHMSDDINHPNPKIRCLRLRWGFLSAVLVELVDLRETTQLNTSLSENFIFTTDMDAEIANLQKLVGCGLGEGRQWRPSFQLERHQVFLLFLKKFKFDTLLLVVRHFRDLRSSHSHILIVAKLVDACLLHQLKEKTFTVQQALLIYEEFPNESRSSHVEIYQVFEDFLKRKTLSPQDVLDLTKLLDYQKLSDETVEKLMAELQFDYDPRLQERFMAKQRGQQIDQEKSKEELIKLRSEHNSQTANLVEVRQELSARSADLTRATEDIRLGESKLEVMRRELEEEKEKTSCMICFSRPRDALSLPCGHFLYCSECLQAHHRRSKTCPTCRGPTTTVLRCLLSV